MWISLYYANSRNPGFIPCNSPDYDMALKQVRMPFLTIIGLERLEHVLLKS